MRQYYYGLLIFLSVLMTAYLKDEEQPPQNPIKDSEQDPSINIMFPHLFPPTTIDQVESEHRKNDKHFQRAVKYLFTTKWDYTVEKLMGTEEYAKFRKMLVQQKFDIDGLMASIIKYGQKIFTDKDIPADVKISASHPYKGSFRRFIRDLLKEYKIATVSQIILEGHDCTREFAEINKDIVKEVGENNVIDNLLNLKDMQKIIRIFRNVDINIKHYFDMLYPILIGYKLSEK